MKVGVSKDVFRRMNGYGVDITELKYISTPKDRYIVEFVEGYVLNKFKNNLTYSSTIKGGYTELFNYDINSLISEMQTVQEKLLKNFGENI